MLLYAHTRETPSHMLYVETQNFKVPAEVWVGFDAETEEFLAHSKCPFHKCSSEIHIFSLNSTDSICSKGSCVGAVLQVSMQHLEKLDVRNAPLHSQFLS